MINIDSKEIKTSIKIIGIFCLLVAGLIYAEIRFINGRQIQCYEDNGFLIKGENDEPYCKPGELLILEGWEIKNHKTLTRTDPIYINNTTTDTKFNFTFN